MEPTLNIQDRLVVNKFIYKIREPKRFDVIVFRFPNEEIKNDLIKRIVGLPGETVAITDGVVFIDGVKIKEVHSMNKDHAYYGPVVIPDDQYFCLGDNRPQSADSRVWGFVPRKKIHGPAFLKIWPIWELGIIH